MVRGPTPPFSGVMARRSWRARISGNVGLLWGGGLIFCLRYGRLVE